MQQGVRGRAQLAQFQAAKWMDTLHHDRGPISQLTGFLPPGMGKKAKFPTFEARAVDW